MRPKIYVGMKPGNVREVFKSATVPTFETHSNIYLATIGPFRTMRGANYMAKYGPNIHCQTVQEAERIAAGFIYDLVLRRWIKKSEQTKQEIRGKLGVK